MILEQQIELYQTNILTRLKAPDLTWEEALEMGLMARNLRDISNWVIGVVALHIEVKWGEKSMADFAKALGFHRTTLEQYRWVIKSFGDDYKPTKGLPWTYYRLAAGTEDPKGTIDKIIENNYTLSQTMNFVRGLPVSVDCLHDFQEEIYLLCRKCRLFRKKPEEIETSANANARILSEVTK